MNKHRYHSLALVAAATLATLSACGSMPAENGLLNEARSDYRQAQDSPQAREFAAAELRQAGASLNRANEAWARDDAVSQVNHLAYLAKQEVALAQTLGRQRAAEQSVEQANAQRSQQRLAARTSEADAAKASADTAQRDARAAQQQAEVSRQQTALARQQASQSGARTLQLEAELREMNAQQTERGLVITIGDLLFDTNQAVLKPDGLSGVDKLAVFMKQHPQRRALVEGFTDSVGNEAANLGLSGRRADAVRQALLAQGLGEERVTARGYGEAHPVASNASSEGRQLNRRVEIVVSGENGQINAR